MRCSNDKLTSHDYDQIMTANQEGNQDLITIQEPFRDDHTFTDDHNSNDFVSIDTSKQPNDANKNSEIVKKKPNSKSGKSSEAIPINAIVKRSSRTSVNDSSIERHEDKVDSNVKKDEILVSQSNDVTHAKNVEAVDVVGDSSDEDASNTVVEESSLVAAKHRTIAAVKVKNKKKKTDESKPSSNKFILTRADINDMLDYKPSSKRKGSELNTTTISGNNDLSIDEMNTTAANANETPLKKYRRKFSTFSSHLSNSNSSIKPTGTFNTSVTKAKPTSIDFSDSESDNVDKISKETVNNGRTKGNPKSQINVTSHATKRNTKSKASSGIVELESENTDSDDLLEVKNSKKKASKESNAMKSKSNSSKSSKR